MFNLNIILLYHIPSMESTPINNICSTNDCANKKQPNYDMCAQHLDNDEKYKNEIYLRNKFDTTKRDIDPITFMCDDGSIVCSFLIQSFQYVCCVCDDDIIGDIYRCANHHSLCIMCYLNIDMHTENKSCPVCRSIEVFEDRTLGNIIKYNIQKCANQNCQFIAFPKKMVEHICEHKKICCFICREYTTPFELNTHLTNNCVHKFRKITIFRNFISFIADKHKYGCRYYSPSESVKIYINKYCVSGIKFVAIQMGDDQEYQLKLHYSILNTQHTVNLILMKPIDLNQKPISWVHIPQHICKKWSNINITLE